MGIGNPARAAGEMSVEAIDRVKDPVARAASGNGPIWSDLYPTGHLRIWNFVGAKVFRVYVLEGFLARSAKP